MSQVFIHGIGAVSPAGWGFAALREALERNESLPCKELERPGWRKPLHARQTPQPPSRPAFLAHPRLRRTSPITQYAVAAALEALGKDAPQFKQSRVRLGIVLCVMSGCVSYSRRFYDETLRDPATASPLVFPETVFNAPSSHLAALLGTTAINYTLVGDPGTFLQGLALAADWLITWQVEAALVIGAEEMDWLTADAFRLFTRRIILSEGAGAIYLRREKADPPAVALQAVTDAYLFWNESSRFEAAAKVPKALATDVTDALLCDGLQDLSRLDAPEKRAWQHWNGPRLSPKKILGEGLMAATAWQCVAAVDALMQARHAAANVSVVGCNQQAIGARFAIAHPRRV